MKGRKRGQRGRTRPFVLTPRDVELLALVGLCRYCSTTQVARELFWNEDRGRPSHDRARKRLRVLYDAGLITVVLAGSTMPNLVGLTPAGRRLLESRDPELAVRCRLTGAIKLTGVAHTLLVNDLRLYLAAAGQPELLAWHGGRGSLAAELGLTGLKLVPDGLAETSAGIVAVEADRGTEQLTTVIRRKVERYAVALAEGRVDELWFAVSSGPKRRAAIEREVVQAGVGHATRVMGAEAVRGRPRQLLPPLDGTPWRFGPSGPSYSVRGTS